MLRLTIIFETILFSIFKIPYRAFRKISYTIRATKHFHLIHVCQFSNFLSFHFVVLQPALFWISNDCDTIIAIEKKAFNFKTELFSHLNFHFVGARVWKHPNAIWLIHMPYFISWRQSRCFEASKCSRANNNHNYTMNFWCIGAFLGLRILNWIFCDTLFLQLIMLFSIIFSNSNAY